MDARFPETLRSDAYAADFPPQQEWENAHTDKKKQEKNKKPDNTQLDGLKVIMRLETVDRAQCW